MHTDPETGLKKNGIAKVRYNHLAMINVILANPNVQQKELAEMFDRSPSWISLVINSDAFQAALAQRRKEVEDPIIAMSIEDRINAVGDKSLEILATRLEQISLFPTRETDEFVLKTAQLAVQAKGYGARQTQENKGPQVAIVVQVPPKITSAEEWAQTHFPAAQQVVEIPS